MADATASTRYAIEPDFASRQAVFSALGWLLLAAGIGFAQRALLVWPDLAVVEFFSYGRVRAAGDTALIWGWLGTAWMAAVFAIVPRVAMAQLHNEVLGAAGVVWWNLTLLAGLGTLVLGLNQGRLWGELLPLFDLALVLVLLTVAYNAAVTAVRRREKTLFVSSWYLLASAAVVPVVYVVGNVEAFTGLTDGVVAAFYRGALEWLWLVPAGLGVAYYVVPTDTGSPVRSMRLARVGFWTLMAVGGWAGARYLVGAPVPAYLKAIGTGMAFVLLVPVLSAASNLFGTARGRWSLIADAPALRWASTGLGLLVVWTVLTAAGALPTVERGIGGTSWDTGLAHLATWGVFPAFAFALVYRLYPLMTGRAWHSTSLVALHFWGTVGGMAIGTLALMGQGIFEAAAARATIEAAQGAARWFALVDLVAFALVGVAQLAFVVNASRTSRTGPPVVVGAQAVRA